MSSNISGRDIAYIATSIAVAVSKQLTVDELNILGNVVTQVGASMLSIAAVEQSRSQAPSSDKSGDISNGNTVNSNNSRDDI